MYRVQCHLTVTTYFVCLHMTFVKASEYLYICLGYTTQVLGIQSHCRFRDLHLETVELCCVASVIPALPILEVSTSLPKSSGFCSMANSECVVASASLNIYAGQRYWLSHCLSVLWQVHHWMSMLVRGTDCVYAGQRYWLSHCLSVHCNCLAPLTQNCVLVHVYRATTVLSGKRLCIIMLILWQT